MLRLFFSSFLLLLSLLVIFRAPTNFLWRVAVAVTEFPYFFFITAFLVLVSTYWMKKYRIPVAVLSGISFVVFLLPVLVNYIKFSSFDEQLEKEFGPIHKEGQLPAAFSFLKMFTGIGIKNVPYTTFAYKKISEKEYNFDYYPANENNPAPCIIIIHGGSWAEGDSQQLPALNSYLANHGYSVASINYRLAPDYEYPAPVEDVNDLLHYLKDHAVELKIDTTNFVLLGRSAGGQIALMAGYTPHNKNIKGIISFYAPADMEWGARVKTNDWVLDVKKVLKDYVGGTIDQIPEKYTACSAPPCVNADVPPTLLIHGPNDAMVSFYHSVRLKKKLDKDHVQNYLLELPTATHGCDYNINGPSGQVSTFAIERFIHAVTRK
jgi:acetyl esterase/lipase